ncbi:Protein of unknown function DUF247 [Macleaya cordata]|uniref:Uncharacterized protein n=1 Tax=Macleaya cordata TaxID=56857 RepID=A0A200Q4M2_MACCD|nr:Protein of unknown function DUF247 [Macleaya cordata]
MASGRRKDASQQIGEGHHASVYETIEIGEDPNNMLADDDSNDNDSSDQQNVEGNHVSTKNETEYSNIKALADNIKGKLESAPPSDFVAQHCIYRVHEKIRKINKSAYTPVVVSIGPFHCGEGRLQAVEECKLIYIRDMLTRATKTGNRWSTILEECVEFIKTIEEEARNCYSEPIKLSSDEFVEMMVVDGFVHHRALSKEGYGNLKDSSFTMLALYFFDSSMPRPVEVLKQYSNYKGDHLLDLLAKTFHPPKHQPSNEMAVYWDFIPSATELKDAGVEFKKGSTKRSFLDIKFSGGVLEIPPIVVQDRTDSFFVKKSYCFRAVLRWRCQLL